MGKVRIAFSESSTAVVPLVAIKKGFLAAEGIEVEAQPIAGSAFELKTTVFRRVR